MLSAFSELLSPDRLKGCKNSNQLSVTNFKEDNEVKPWIFRRH